MEFQANQGYTVKLCLKREEKKKKERKEGGNDNLLNSVVPTAPWKTKVSRGQ